MSSELVNKLYQDIENKILSYEYENGHILTEQGIAKEWGVSRTPVREVFQLLSANGYIAEEGKGVRVKTFTHKDILDIYDLRIMMEGLSGRLAAENIDNISLDKMQEIVYLQKMYLENGNTERIWELDNEFHQIIYSSSKNRLLQKMLNDFLHYTKFVRKHSYEVVGRSTASVDEHYNIFTAIKSKNFDLTETLLKNHAAKVRENIIKYVEI